MCAFVRSCVRACVRSCVRAFVRSCVRAFVRSFVRAFVRSCVRSFVRVCVLVRVFHSDVKVPTPSLNQYYRFADSIPDRGPKIATKSQIRIRVFMKINTAREYFLPSKSQIMMVVLYIFQL